MIITIKVTPQASFVQLLESFLDESLVLLLTGLMAVVAVFVMMMALGVMALTFVVMVAVSLGFGLFLIQRLMHFGCSFLHRFSKLLGEVLGRWGCSLGLLIFSWLLLLLLGLSAFVI